MDIGFQDMSKLLKTGRNEKYLKLFLVSFINYYKVMNWIVTILDIAIFCQKLIKKYSE